MGRFSIIILTIGIPGSGKTTWVNEYIKTHPLTYVVSTDDLRKELTGFEQCIDPSQNTMIHDEARNRVKKILEDPNSKGGFGPEIIVDSTNCDVEEWIKYKQLNSSLLLAKVFETPPLTAMKHQETRERKVPLEIVEMKWNQYQKNKHLLSKIFNMVDFY